MIKKIDLSGIWNFELIFLRDMHGTLKMYILMRAIQIKISFFFWSGQDLQKYG